MPSDPIGHLNPRVKPRAARTDALLVDLLQEHVDVDRDVIVLDERTWAIHGYIAYDGQVIAATFGTEGDAWAALTRLDELQRGV